MTPWAIYSLRCVLIRLLDIPPGYDMLTTRHQRPGTFAQEAGSGRGFRNALTRTDGTRPQPDARVIASEPASPPVRTVSGCTV